jgi:hypothetical protein
LNILTAVCLSDICVRVILGGPCRTARVALMFLLIVAQTKAAAAAAAAVEVAAVAAIREAVAVAGE